MEVQQSFEISGMTQTMVQHHIPQDLNLQQHSWENLKFRTDHVINYKSNDGSTLAELHMWKTWGLKGLKYNLKDLF
jgi:hypothetical protein